MDSSAQSVTRQHCRRVAAVALEIGRSLGIASRLTSGIEEAALFHHSFDFGSGALVRLAAEVCAAGEERPPAPQPPGSAETAAILALLRSPRARGGDSETRRAAAVIRMCSAFDEQIEALPFEYKPYDVILEELREIGVFEGFDSILIDCLCRFRLPLRIPEVISRLPLQARVAQEVFRRFAASREYELDELELITARDPVLAGALIKVANSALYSPQRRVSTLRQAITYVGTAAARDVILACSIRPLFASAGLLRLWSHSLHLAQLSSALGESTGILEPRAAMLLGLVHDVGALVVQTLGGAAAASYQRLLEKGCPASYIELLFFGRDHGELGSEILEEWNFPEHLVEAVRFHHQPERSARKETALLFLAEFWSGMDEDVASSMRIEDCVRRTGISLDDLVETATRKNALSILRSVA